MYDSKMEDVKDNVSDTHNGDSKDNNLATNVEEQNEELTNPQQTKNVINNLPYSNGEGIETGVQSLIGTIETYELNFDEPALSANEIEDSIEPSATSPDSRNELQIDLPIQLTSVEPNVTALEREAESDTKSNLNGMELDGEIKGEETFNGKEAPLNDRKLNTDVDITLDGEQREEKPISHSNGLLDVGTKDNDFENVVAESELPMDNGLEVKEELDENEVKEELSADELDGGDANNSFLLGPGATEDEETGTLEEQRAFVNELEIFHRERCLDFRPPRFYQEPLNLLKLWRAVVRLGGYEQVTSCKLWRQIGESFKPPKTCTTVSWTFRCFYEKALLEYEKHKLRCGELPYKASFPEHIGVGTPLLAIGSGRQRRDAAARAMQGWHSQRLLGNGEVGDPIIKDKASTSSPKRERPVKSIGLLKRRKPSVECSPQVVRMRPSNLQSEADVVDIGHPADWVKINVQRTKDCFEVYALVPGLLREEVRVQSDAVGRLVISGEPEQSDNPWGVTPFRKVVSLPSRIDPHQTSAVVTLHGQLFVRVPFDPLDI